MQTPAPSLPELSLPPGDMPRFRINADRKAETAQRRRLVRGLTQARQDAQIALHFRPRHSLSDGQIIGAEAMLRWAPRRQKMLRSLAIFALAEQAGEAASLAGWALGEACQLATHWPSQGLLVSVRIPPALHHAPLIQLYLAEALESSGLAPDRLELRFAEPDLAALDYDALLGLCAIRDLGVGVALEHFGTGATSLGVLRRLPLSAITFSASLSSHVPHDREDSTILRAIIAACRALGLETVADGVTSQAQCSFLANAGCDAAQGALFSTDLPQAALVERLTKA